MTNQLTPEMLSMLFGVALSFLMQHVPAFSNWFVLLAGSRKRWVTVGLIVVFSTVLYALACNPNTAELIMLWTAGKIIIICGEVGIWSYIGTVLFVALGNQTTFLLSAASKADPEIIHTYQGRGEYKT